MTNRDDVIRQVEAVLNDSHYPPTPEQKEILTSVLRRVNKRTAEFGDEQKTGQDCLISFV